MDHCITQERQTLPHLHRFHLYILYWTSPSQVDPQTNGNGLKLLSQLFSYLCVQMNSEYFYSLHDSANIPVNITIVY